MNEVKKIAGINLVILLLYMTFAYMSRSTHVSEEFGFTLLGVALLIAAHVFLNIVISFVFFIKSNKRLGRAYLLSALVVLVIGFSSCLGSIMI